MGHKFFLTPTVQMCDFKARIYLDTFFLLNCNVIYHIKSYYSFFSLFFPFQEPVEILGPVEIHANRIDSVNGVSPTCTRI